MMRPGATCRKMCSLNTMQATVTHTHSHFSSGIFLLHMHKTDTQECLLSLHKYNNLMYDIMCLFIQSYTGPPDLTRT